MEAPALPELLWVFLQASNATELVALSCFRLLYYK